MASVKTNFAVGVFMITGIVIATAVVIFVGASTYLRHGRLYSTFYDESIQGLSKDSPVKYRGVSIGQVQDIRIAKDTKLVEVLLRIESDWQPDALTVAQLKSIGITGIMYVELDIKQPHEKVLHPDYKTEYPVIPTRSSDIEQLFSGIEELVNQVKGTDFQGVSQKMYETIETINQSLADAQIKKIASGLETTLNQVNQIFNDPKLRNILYSAESAGTHLDNFSRKAEAVSAHIDNLISNNETDLNQAIKDLRSTMEQAGLLIKRTTGTMNKAEESFARIEENLIRTINHLESASDSLSTLTDRSAAQPSLLLFATPLPEKKIEPYD